MHAKRWEHERDSIGICDTINVHGTKDARDMTNAGWRCIRSNFERQSLRLCRVFLRRKNSRALPDSAAPAELCVGSHVTLRFPIRPLQAKARAAGGSKTELHRSLHNHQVGTVRLPAGGGSAPCLPRVVAGTRSGDCRGGMSTSFVF